MKPWIFSLKCHCSLDLVTADKRVRIQTLVEKWKGPQPCWMRNGCYKFFPFVFCCQCVTNQDEQDSSEKKTETDKLPALIKVCYWFHGLQGCFLSDCCDDVVHFEFNMHGEKTSYFVHLWNFVILFWCLQTDVYSIWISSSSAFKLDGLKIAANVAQRNCFHWFWLYSFEPLK